MPVSLSTETSAICTPPTPLLVRSGGLDLSGFLPRTVIGIAPTFEHASFHDKLRLGSLFTRTVTFTASSSSGFAFRDGATFANSRLRASTAARRVDEVTPPEVVLPPLAPETG